MKPHLEIIQADITRWNADAIVNAANEQMLGGGGSGEAELLASCYRHSLWLAMCLGVRTIAFPAISCGIYGYPIDQAALISTRTITQAIEQETGLEKITLVAFDEEVFSAWNQTVSSRISDD